MGSTVVGVHPPPLTANRPNDTLEDICRCRINGHQHKGVDSDVHILLCCLCLYIKSCVSFLLGGTSVKSHGNLTPEVLQQDKQPNCKVKVTRKNQRFKKPSIMLIMVKYFIV